jgi:signal peptide peptidase SppA
MKQYPHVLAAVYDQPWLVTAPTLQRICAIVDAHAIGEPPTPEEIAASIAAAAGTNGPRRGGSQQGAVAVIPVYGVISGRANMMSEYSGGTTAESVTRAFRAAMADADVASIVFDIDSPGGQVDGIPELAAEILAARGNKPMAAVACHMAASAAYYIASACDEIVCSPSGQVGSVGVRAGHMDDSKAREMAGLKRTLISAPPAKSDGYDGDPISEEGQAYLQEQVNSLYAMFVAAVAKGRGVPVATVKADYGSGRMLLAKDAQAAGMIDRIATLDETIARLQKGNTAPRPLGQAAPGALAVDYADLAVAALDTARTYGLISSGDSASTGSITASAFDVASPAFTAGPIPVHHGPTDDGPWDGPAEEASIPNSKGADTYRRMYAWEDDTAENKDTKAAHKFLHHFWRSGAPGPASTIACSTGIGYLNRAPGAPGHPNIPDGDRQGVWDHLAAHLRDANSDNPDYEPPPLQGQADDASGTADATDMTEDTADLASGQPYAQRLELALAEARDLAEQTQRRAAMRAEAGRHLSAETREHLAGMSEAFAAVGADLAELAASAPPIEPPRASAIAPSIVAMAQLALREAERSTPR